ncbi:MAG: Minf_1886 family protein [Planctomycetota bacterium]|jgi:uncharacterized repeat protein (TIGR04138 family)
MTTRTTTSRRIEALAAEDSRYGLDAYHFVFDCLDFVLEREAADLGRRVPADEHVSIPKLLDGLRAYALQEYGPLARLVLERWGVYRTEDFGEIVFALVTHGLLNKQESDRLSDFRNGFNFREAFDKAWRSSPTSIQ